MTTEPRQEARELIRHHVGVRILPHGTPHLRVNGALVDALAAAIEVVETADTSNAIHEEPVSVWMVEYDRLREALSALRGDETWHAS